MTKDILEKLLEQTVLFFLSGIIIVVLGATGGFTIGTVNLTVSEIWWSDFVIQLNQNEYDDVLSIEHEDYSLPPIVRVTKSIELLRNVIG